MHYLHHRTPAPLQSIGSLDRHPFIAGQTLQRLQRHAPFSWRHLPPSDHPRFNSRRNARSSSRTLRTIRHCACFSPQDSARHHSQEETMRRLLTNRARRLQAPAWAMLCAIAVGGCVSTETHTKTLTELEAAKKIAVQQAADLDALKKKVSGTGRSAPAAISRATTEPGPGSHSAKSRRTTGRRAGERTSGPRSAIGRAPVKT